jgi:hypothetical protein
LYDAGNRFNQRGGPVRSIFRSRSVLRLTTQLGAAGIALALALVLAGCYASTTEPANGPLTGTWIIVGVDTYVQLSLEQRDTLVTGNHGLGGFTGGVDGFTPGPPVSGTATLPSVTLHWTSMVGSTTYHYTFAATLSDDGQTLSGVESVAGDSSEQTRVYHRRIVN